MVFTVTFILRLGETSKEVKPSHRLRAVGQATNSPILDHKNMKITINSEARH